MEWTLRKTLRRMKNVIVVLEWIPTVCRQSGDSLVMPVELVPSSKASSKSSMGVSKQTEALLQRTFAMLDVGRTGFINVNAVQQAISSL